MKPVEMYVYIKKGDIEEVLLSRNFLTFQGNNLLFTQGDDTEEEMQEFLGMVFDVVGKIAVRDRLEKVYIISDKWGEDVIEPSCLYEDASIVFNNDVQKMSEFISFGHKSYEV